MVPDELVQHDQDTLSHACRVLIIDDMEAVRDTLNRILEDAGFETVMATDGKEGLALLAQGSIDMVLCDVIMPGMTGFDVLQRIRQSHGISQLPVIMITSYDQMENLIKALSLGANDFMSKPIKPAIVLARMRTHWSLLQSERALRESEERYALAAQGAKDGLWDWNLKTRSIYFSDRWKEMLGFMPDEMESTERNWFDRVHPDDLERLHEELKRHLDGATDHFSCEYRLLHRGRQYIWVFCRGKALRDDQGRANRIAGSQTDITYQNLHDTLTGLPKRQLFLHSVTRARERAASSGQFDFAILFLDTVRFKRINDTFGYELGDQILIEIKRRIEACLSAQDTLARLEGGDFAVLRSSIPDRKDAFLLAQKIQEEVGVPIDVAGHRVKMEISIAVVLGSDQEASAEELLRNAHTALSHAKGKAECVMFSQPMKSKAIERVRMEEALRNAASDGSLKLYYQPQVDLQTEDVHGFEVLLRWHHPKWGWIAPDRFIPIAEDTGLILPIGEWVMRGAARQAAAWDRAGFRPFRLSVNFSTRQFSQLDLIDQIQVILNEEDFDPCRFEMEITESTIMEDMRSSGEVLNQLKDLGIDISIDDFGTGYSSLGYLQRLPINRLKIDKSFLERIPPKKGERSLTEAIIALAHNLNLKVVAEGVENRDQIRFLQLLGCDWAQGRYYSMPVPPDKAVEYLNK